MSEATEKPNYKKTVNLPKTQFPMKANLLQNENQSIKRWDKLGLYEKLRELGPSKPKGRFVFHDGPPYANGSIHLGHLMNKCLKDFVVRSRTVMGWDTPYVPGWDCHGLPIEHKVMTGLVESGKIKKLLDLDEDKRRVAIRRECQKNAEKFQKLQAEQMQRLLTLADYADPYLTMQPRYEREVLEVLGDLCREGLVYRALKPVHWSVDNETALAEAELEYYDREDLSVFVDFECADAADVYGRFGLAGDDQPSAKPSLMIWTTTPWTLPANMAVAVNEKYEYALVRVDGNVTVLASGLVEQVTKQAGSDSVEVLATTTGDKLLGVRYKSPLREDVPATDQSPDKVWTVVQADYVTLEDGTGLVHTATGHGADDYQTGLREGIGVYCPVRGDGTYDESVPEWLRGMHVFKANALVADRLAESGHLFHSNKFMHSYPHDWRSKGPVIFRATEQWFVGVDRPTKRDDKSLRDLALKKTETDVEYIPAWGKNRMRGMLESRPDWCISRQRAWGLPIPSFTLPSGESFMTEAVVRAVAKVVSEKGSDAWFTMSAEELLVHYDPAQDSESPREVRDGEVTTAALSKGRDILDVWFESGSSWNAVMHERSGGEDFPVDLYLEGSDQHRGWFQSSLIAGLGSMGEPPYKALLTHGFMVNKDGKKLSKSSGDTIEELFKEFGADVLRWWVSSLAYENDVKVDHEFFKGAGESYRKVRNTLRFMLSNLYDFDSSLYNDYCQVPETSIDAWFISKLNRLTKEVTKAYSTYQFRKAHLELYDFCNDTLSSRYLVAIKDRLYCDHPDSPRRLHSQATIWHATDQLCRLLSPILCHTADECYRELHKDPDACVHLVDIHEPKPQQHHIFWDMIDELTPRFSLLLHFAKERFNISNSLDLRMLLPAEPNIFCDIDTRDLADLLGISQVEFYLPVEIPTPENLYDVIWEGIKFQDLSSQNYADDFGVKNDKYPRCDRSWKRDGTVRERSDGGMLSDRDAEALGLD